MTNSRNELRKEIKNQVSDERKLLIQILENLRIVESERLYLEWGFSSMFDYCTRELGYSEAAAQRRIQAMRLMKSVPEIKQSIQDGSLSLSVAAQVQGFFQNENKHRKETKESDLIASEKVEILNQVLHTSSRECERILLDLAEAPVQSKEKTKALSSKETLIQFTADEELNDYLEKLKHLTSHKNPGGRYDILFKELAKIALEKLDPETRKTKQSIQKPKKVERITPSQLSTVKTPTSEVKHSRYISQSLRQKIWKRDGGCCTYIDSISKVRCRSRYKVQIEHIIPFAKGGPTAFENLTLLCAGHNRLQGIKHFGVEKMRVEYLVRETTGH